MARRRDKPAGCQATPPRKREKLRSGPSQPRNSCEDKSIDGLNNDLMDHGSESTPNVGMSRPTTGPEALSQVWRQLRTTRMNSQSAGSDTLHRTTSRTLSAVSSDEDSSFSETADKLLSPQSRNIEDARSEYHHVKNDCDKGIEEVLSYLPLTMDDGQRTTLQQYILLFELRLAKAKLRLGLAISHRATQHGQQTDLPKLAITKGWLDEGLRRIETPTIKLNYESGYLFWELSHFFLATIITQHHDSMFEGRILPSVHEVVDIFQQTEPRSYAPGIGPFLELATGMNTSDPLLMPEILRRLESRMETETSANDRRNLDTNTSLVESQAQLGHHPMKTRAYRPPAYTTTADGVQHEIDPYLDSSPVGNSPAAYQLHYEDSVEDNTESLQDQNSASMVSTFEVELEEDEETVRPHVIDRGPIQAIDDEEMLRPELDGVLARQIDFDAKMDHDRSLSVISDIFDEVMQDAHAVGIDLDQQQITSVTHNDSRNILPPVLSGNTPAVPAPTPTRFSISDSQVMSDDEPEPDSNPFLAANRAIIAAPAAASAVDAPTSSTPDVSSSRAPVVLPTKVTRPARLRTSEPIVLVSSPARGLAEQVSLTGQHTSQRQRIEVSIIISDDDSENELPPSSNPHLAALMQVRASAPASSPASASNTPTSSASTSKSVRPKLPPHLARVRRAAHRTSLDPSSQLATPEEMRVLDQEEYPLIDIIDEKIVDEKKKYLIKWKPIHGRRFLDTWEPAENANAASVEDWEFEKARRQKGKAPTKSKKAGEREQGLIEKAATELATQESLPEDAPMSLADTAGDESLVLRGARSVSVSVSYTSSSSDQVSSRTRSRANVGDDAFAGSPESTRRLTPEPASDLPPRYAAQPFSINAVSPEPIVNPAQEPLANIATEAAPAASTKIDNSNKYKTQKQQKARMREKREIRRAEKAERLANMTEEKRAELEHSKKMQKKSKRERKQTKAERLAEMPEEERKELDKWLQWKKGVRARTKQDKKNRQANKAKKREEEARKQAQKSTKSS
jgi:hypothetical protein